MVGEWQSSAQRVCFYLPDWASGGSSEAERWRGILQPLNVRVWQVQSCKKLRWKMHAVASGIGSAWRGFAREGAQWSPAFFILCHNLPMRSCTVPGKHLQWGVPEQWLAMQLTNAGLHHLGINPPSDHLLQVVFFRFTFMPSRITFI